MRKAPKAIDGFVPRNANRKVGEVDSKRRLGQAEHANPIGADTNTTRAWTGNLPAPRPVTRQEVDDSLKDIDDETEVKPKRRLFGRRRNKPPVSRRRKIIKRSILAFVVIVLLVAAFIGIKAFIAGTSIFKGNIFDIFQNAPLKTDAKGRSNILVFGTSGSIDDTRHDGADLTDTLMVLSIDQKKKNAFMISLPRDLYVDYGAACAEGYQGKINSMYDCYSNGGTNDEAGAKALQKKIKQVTGLSMQYYAHINWAVVVSAVNAVGGVDVNVEGNGYNYYCINSGIPKGGIVDVNMGIKYAPGKHHMNGEQALRFSRARGSAGACGLDRGDYDRQANQQKVLVALRQKAVSAGTVTNLGKVTGLIDALGKNLRTDFATSEIRTLMSLAQDIPSDKIKSISLVGDDKNLIVGDMINGASVQLPVAGMYEYSEIQSYIKKKVYANAISREDAHVALFNGSGVEGYASQQSDRLEALGFTVTAAGNAPQGSYQSVEIYDLSNGKNPATKSKLESVYGVTAKKGKGPITVTGDTDFVVIFGATPSAN